MPKTLPPLSISLQTRQGKDNKNRHKTQSKRFFKYLKKHNITCSMAAKALRIPQKCLTRYKRELEKNGLLWETHKAECKLTGFYAYYLTTDKAKAQLSKTSKTALQ